MQAENLKLEIRSSVRFLLNLNPKMDPYDVYKSIIKAYGENVITERTIRTYVSDILDGQFSIYDGNKPGRPVNQDYIIKVRDYMAANPFSSARQCAKCLCINKSTVISIFCNVLHLHQINIRNIPYELDSIIKKNRVRCATQLYNRLSKYQIDTLNRVFTEDEIWIYYRTPRKWLWMKEGDSVPTQPEITIGAKKAMFAVIWGRTGVKSVTMLPQNEKFTKDFFANVVLDDFSKVISTKGKIFHCDNARPHLCPEKFKALGLSRLEHPAYSPDLAPSDFFLFGYLRKLIEGKIFHDENTLYQQVVHALKSIENHKFVKAYDNWINRLYTVATSDGSYVCEK